MALEINLEYYQVFFYVAKLGSISKAAEAMHLTQPAVSHIIKLLEDKLGSKLFYRRARGVELTNTGGLLLPYVHSMLNQITAGEKRIMKISNLEEGDLYIGSIETALAGILPQYLRRFSQEYPKIRIHIKGPSSSDILAGVLCGTLDLGFIVSPVETVSNKLHFTPLHESRDIFIAGNAFAHLKDRAVPLSEILEQPLICLQKTTAGRSFLEAYAKNIGVELKPAYSVYSPTTIIQLAECGLGVGVLLEKCAQEELSSGRCFEVHCESLLPERQLYMVISKEFPPSNACRKFTSLIGSRA